MSDSATYSVSVGHGIQEGFDTDQVYSAFAQLVKISPEKSVTYLSAIRTLKKELDEKTARLYKKKLEGIGRLFSGID